MHNENMIRWFLAHGASPNASNSGFFRTPIMYAAAMLSLSIVKLLYAYGVTHESVLQCAAESTREGRLEVLEFVVEKGADINAIKWQHHAFTYDCWGRASLGTALHYAVTGGYKDRVALLLRKGARTDIPNTTGQTALDIARESGQKDILDMLNSV